MFRLDSDLRQISNKVFLLLADACLIVLSLTVAMVLPSFSSSVAWDQLLRPGTLGKFLFVILAFTLVLHYTGLYSFSLTTKPRALLVRSLRAMGFACLVLAILYAWHPHSSLGGKTTGVAVTLILVGLLGWRLVLGTTRLVKKRMERVLVLGTGAVGREIAREVRSADDVDIEIVGFIDDGSTKNLRLPAVESGVIGHVPDLETVVHRERVDRVVVSLPERRGRMPIEQLLRLKFMGVKVEDAHNAYERLTGRINLEHLSPSWLIMASGFRNAGLWLTIKYALDFVFSGILLIVFAPVMVLVALAIRIETGRPVLFVQDRVGQNGRHFRVFKFRSMYNRSDSSQARWASDEDHRITRVGRFIRKFRLDELPQLFNVLRGEMSLVGPRPEQPYFCHVLESQVPYYAERHSVRPGITGWAQVKYKYGASVDQSITKLEYDLFYLKHMSPLLDMAILFSTIHVLLSGKGAK